MPAAVAGVLGLAILALQTVSLFSTMAAARLHQTKWSPMTVHFQECAHPIPFGQQVVWVYRSGLVQARVLANLSLLERMMLDEASRQPTSFSEAG